MLSAALWRLAWPASGESMFHRERDASKLRWCISSAACAPADFTCSTPNLSPITLNHSARSKSASVAITPLLEEAIVGEADFGALTLDRPVSGNEALARIR